MTFWDFAHEHPVLVVCALIGVLATVESVVKALCGVCG